MNKILCISPLYNKLQFLPYTIASILNQKGVELNLVIIDDCSTDGSYEWVMENLSEYPNVHIIRNNENKGCYQSRNAGLKYAIDNGIEFDYYTVTDPDDQQFEDRFSTILKDIEHQPDIFFLKQAFIKVHLNGTVIEKNTEAGEGCAVIKKDVFDLIGYWDNTLRFGGDTEYMHRLGNYLYKNGQSNIGDYIRNNNTPLMYALTDDTKQNLTLLHPIDSPERIAVLDYIKGFTIHCKLEDCYYDYENQGHDYPSVRFTPQRN